MQRAPRELAGGEQPVAVGPDGKKRRITQVEQPGEADHLVEPDREQDVDPRVGRGADQVISSAACRHVSEAWEEECPDDEQRVNRSVAILECPNGPAHRRVTAQQGPAHFSGTCMPSSPAGRNTSTRIRMAKIQTSVSAAW